MRHATLTLLATMAVSMAGCHDNSPPPPRVPVPVPASQTPMTYRSDVTKPLPPPPQEEALPAPPFDDVPLVSQQPPEQPAFIEAYRRVGAPRIVLFVNRTLEGNVIQVGTNQPVDASRNNQPIQSGPAHTDPFESTGLAEYHQSTDVYLHPGQYDEVSARSLDYQAVENIMTDWLACNGQVTIISPIMARQRLNEQQLKDLQEGRPQVMSDIVQQLGADILVQVQAHPTKQTRAGLEVRILAEALNVKGGQSIGRAVVDVPPPLEKTTINRYTRFLARKLMDEMTGSWMAPPLPRPPEQQEKREPSQEPAPPAVPAPSPLPAPAPMAPPASTTSPIFQP